MNKFLRLLAVPLAALAFSTIAVGDDQSKTTPTVRPADQILGMNIRNQDNQSLGHIEDLVVNVKTGKLVYAAMARGQILGFGGSLYAIAPEALQMSANGENLILNASNSDFENVRGFDQNAWPTAPNRRWGQTAAATTTERRPETGRETGTVKSNQDLARVSALQGLYVYGSNKKSLGRAYDLVINWPQHEVAYVAVQQGAGAFNTGGKLYAVPLTALSLQTPPDEREGRAFHMNATQQDFDRANSFTSDHWPNQPAEHFRDLRSSNR
jgi:sporulation protein YlmC with PRC-barrel domain